MNDSSLIGVLIKESISISKACNLVSVSKLMRDRQTGKQSEHVHENKTNSLRFHQREKIHLINSSNMFDVIMFLKVMKHFTKSYRIKGKPKKHY